MTRPLLSVREQRDETTREKDTYDTDAETLKQRTTTEAWNMILLPPFPSILIYISLQFSAKLIFSCG